MLQDFNKLFKSIFCLLLVVEVFSLQKVVEMLEEVEIGWREVRWIWQMRQNFAPGPICSTFEMLAVQCEVEHCCAELGPLTCCWPRLAVGFAVFGASHWFAEHTSQMWWFYWASESCSGSHGQQTTKQWSVLVQIWLCKVLWSFFLVQPLSWS